MAQDQYRVSLSLDNLAGISNDYRGPDYYKSFVFQQSITDLYLPSFTLSKRIDSLSSLKVQCILDNNTSHKAQILSLSIIRDLRKTKKHNVQIDFGIYLDLGNKYIIEIPLEKRKLLNLPGLSGGLMYRYNLTTRIFINSQLILFNRTYFSNKKLKFYTAGLLNLGLGFNFGKE